MQENNMEYVCNMCAIYRAFNLLKAPAIMTLQEYLHYLLGNVGDMRAWSLHIFYLSSVPHYKFIFSKIVLIVSLLVK